LMVGCIVLLSGCANMNPMPEASKQLQQDAIARWQGCLKRQAGTPKSKQIRDAANELRSRCEGHRRDVLMSFPASAGRRLNALLMEHTLRSALTNPVVGPNSSQPPQLNLPSSTAIQSPR